jgi:pimeloyl-ACP methyl ester carboxylesterase
MLEQKSLRRRWLYLSGLGTGTGSVKGRALAERLVRRGIRLEFVDLRVPSFRDMRFAAMLEQARNTLGDDGRSAVLVGASFGGLVATALAATDKRVDALVLYAPAFSCAAFRHHYPGVAWLWEQLGWLPIPDKTVGRLRRVDVGLLHELDRLSPEMPAITVPTLVVHRRRDLIVPPTVSRTFAQRHPGVRLLELAGGHNLRAELPRALDETERFLEPWYS